MTSYSSVFRGALLMFGVAMLPLAVSPSHAAAPLPTTTLTVKDQKITAEVAATPDDRSTGLMHRFSLRPDSGMLFIFERAEPQAFWMKNTFIPLSIALSMPRSDRQYRGHGAADETTLVARTRSLRARDAQRLVCGARDQAGDRVEGIQKNKIGSAIVVLGATAAGL
jgi:hypothetical protein